MVKLTYENKYGDRLDLTSNPFFFLINADGLTSAQADLAVTSMATMDMSFINNAVVQKRTIAFDLQVKSGVNVEQAKRAILSVIKPKQAGTLWMEFPDRVQTIKGMVESIDMPRFSKAVTLSVSFFCTSPFWEDAEEKLDTIDKDIDIHYWGSDQLYFTDEGIVLGMYSDSYTRTFLNYGDVAVGMTISIIATAPVQNPMVYNTQNNEYIKFAVSMEAGDELIIDTRKGQKKAQLNGVNVLDKMVAGSTFIQLDVGEQEFTMTNDNEGEGAYFAISYHQQYV